MQLLPTPLAGLALIEPRVFGDERGWFMETWNERTLAGLGLEARFVQDNHSRSARGILRGLHWQRPPAAQVKLVRCLAGSVVDAVVDLRRSSPTCGRGWTCELSAANRRMLWVPAGFAHGFLVTSEHAEVAYKVSAYWSKDDERGLRWDDPAPGLAWPDLGTAPRLNQRDTGFPLLRDLPAADLFP